jgi:hypothetical protein
MFFNSPSIKPIITYKNENIYDILFDCSKSHCQIKLRPNESYSVFYKRRDQVLVCLLKDGGSYLLTVAINSLIINQFSSKLNHLQQLRKTIVNLIKKSGSIFDLKLDIESMYN